jgi:hypothetical protein
MAVASESVDRSLSDQVKGLLSIFLILRLNSVTLRFLPGLRTSYTLTMVGRASEGFPAHIGAT